RKWWPALLDIILCAISFYVVSLLWERYYFEQPGYFKSSFFYFNIPLYTLIVSVAMWLNGAYDPPFETRASWLGWMWSFIGILVIYAMLPVHLRTSRMVIVMGMLA